MLDPTAPEFVPSRHFIPPLQRLPSLQAPTGGGQGETVKYQAPLRLEVKRLTHTSKVKALPTELWIEIMTIYFKTHRSHVSDWELAWIDFRRVSRTLKAATEEAFVKAALRPSDTYYLMVWGESAQSGLCPKSCQKQHVCSVGAAISSYTFKFDRISYDYDDGDIPKETGDSESTHAIIIKPPARVFWKLVTRRDEVVPLPGWRPSCVLPYRKPDVSVLIPLEGQRHYGDKLGLVGHDIVPTALDPIRPGTGWRYDAESAEVSVFLNQSLSRLYFRQAELESLYTSFYVWRWVL